MSWFAVSASVYAAAVVFAVVVIRSGRPGSGPPPAYGTLRLDEVAYLAGGPGRFADVTLLAADRRGAVTLGATVRPLDSRDPVAAELVAAGEPPLAEARRLLAGGALARATGARLRARGMLTQARPRALPVAFTALAAAPVIGLLGLCLGAAGSVTADTAAWAGHAGLWLIAALACGGMAYVLLTRFERIDGPIADHVPGLLWRVSRDAAELHRLGGTLPGGAGLGPVAVIGTHRLPEAGLAQMLAHAAASAGPARAGEWTEQAWARAAAARGPLGAPTYLETRPPVPPAVPPGSPPAEGDGSLPWETAPGADPYTQPAGPAEPAGPHAPGA